MQPSAISYLCADGVGVSLRESLRLVISSEHLSWSRPGENVSEIKRMVPFFIKERRGDRSTLGA